MTRRVGFLVDQGVELRHFALSGLVSEYRKNDFQVVLLLTKRFDTPFFKEYIEKYDLLTQVIPSELINYPASKFESRLRLLRDARKRIRKEPLYSHFIKKEKADKRLELLARIPLLVNLIHWIGLRNIKRHYVTSKTIQEFAEMNLQKIIILEYGSKVRTLLGFLANEMSIEINVYLNTLKTMYINDFLAFRPDKLFVWTKDQEVNYYKSNEYHKEGFVENLGSPFHTFLRRKNHSEICDVCMKYGIVDGRKFVLYSMIYEKVYAQEHLLIEKIYRYLQDEFSEDKRPQLAIRRNPFEEDDSGIQYLKEKCPNLIVCDHYWERDASKNWSLQGLQGEIEWKALLYRADLLLNIPSMSTIDAMMTQTKTGNIFFDENMKYNSKVQHILESPFSKIFSQSSFVEELRDINELRSMLFNNEQNFNYMILPSKLSKFLQ